MDSNYWSRQGETPLGRHVVSAHGSRKVSNPACYTGESANHHRDRLMAEVAARIFGSSGSRADACRRLTGIAIDRPYLKGDQAAKLPLSKAGDAMPVPSDGLSWNWPALGAR